MSYLHTCIKFGRYDLLEVFHKTIFHDLNIIDSDKRTILHYICQYSEPGAIDAVKYLVENKANLNMRDKEGNTPIFLIFKSNNSFATEICKILIENKADISMKDSSGESIIDMINSFEPKIKNINSSSLNSNSSFSSPPLDQTIPAPIQKEPSRVNSKSCANCGSTQNLKKCGACLSIKFCSVSCQKVLWKTHKSECQRRTKENSK